MRCSFLYACLIGSGLTSFLGGHAAQIRMRSCTVWGPEGDMDIVARPRSAEPASWPPSPESPCRFIVSEAAGQRCWNFPLYPVCWPGLLSPPEPGCGPPDGPSGPHVTSWVSLSPRIPPASRTPVLSFLGTIHQPELPREPEGMASPWWQLGGLFSMALRLL